MRDKKGVMYILTNPSFPDCVKIGYVDDIEKLLKQLNRSEFQTIRYEIAFDYRWVKSRLANKILWLSERCQRNNQSDRRKENLFELVSEKVGE